MFLPGRIGRESDQNQGEDGKEHPSVRVGTFSPPFRQVFSEQENSEMISTVNSFSPNVLFVGMTAPKQEKWVYEHREKLNVSLICPVGAVFDFYAGTVQRSGQFWIKLGLEWLPRLLHEPRRLWKRRLSRRRCFCGMFFWRR